MTQKKRILIAVSLVAVVLILVGAAAALLVQNNSYASKVEAGYRYLEANDYSNAILSFRSAIDMDETQEAAYYGLYLTYVATGDSDSARATLAVCVQKVPGTQLATLLVQYDSMLQGSVQTDSIDEDKQAAAVLNTELLSLFSSACYGDYCARYEGSTGTYSNGVYQHYIQELGVTLTYFNANDQQVVDASMGVPYKEFLPNEIVLDNITSLFGVSKLDFDTLKGLSGVYNARKTDNTIVFVYNDCEVTIHCGSDGMITADCANSIVPTNEPLENTLQYSFSTTIMDAATNAPLKDAKVRIFAGYTTFGDAAEEGTTDYSGHVSFDFAESGMYTVEVSKAGYITETFEVQILSNVARTDKTFHISPALSGDAIRFVLTWGSVPSDLDSHLLGTASDGTGTHIYFSNKVQNNSRGDKIAELDVDETNSFGPETVTLYDTAGNYEFIIDDYTNSGLIGVSGAVVKIYVGSSLYQTLSVPSDIMDQWHVCTIRNGNITITNRNA